MDPFPNHAFQPGSDVSRADLAQAMSRLLTVIGTRHPRLGERWRAARPQFADLPPAHLGYPAAAMAVDAAVLPVLDGNTFQPGRVVTGEEAVAAVERLEQILRDNPIPTLLP
jgi:hypothetical protein